MSNWGYWDNSKTSVYRINADGSAESALATRPDIAAWIAAGNVPLDPPPPPPPSCLLWQLQAVLTPAQWTAVQTAIAALNNPAVTAFMQHGTNVIPANSTTFLSIAATIGLTAEQATALVKQANTISIP